MIYKVSEVVKELGVSRQTVYKKLRREVYKPYIVEVDGVTGITEEGLLKLKGIEEKEIDIEVKVNDEVTEVTDSVSKLQKDLIESLHKQVEHYEGQLDVKDKQLQEKDNQINELLKITENGQVLQKMVLSNTEVKLLAYREELEVRRNESSKKAQDGILTKIIGSLRGKKNGE